MSRNGFVSAIIYKREVGTNPEILSPPSSCSSLKRDVNTMETFSELENNLNLTNLPVSIFKCPVCQDIPIQRKIFQCRNGHIICEMCNSNLLFSVFKCPTCRVTISDQIRNRALEAALEFMERCSYRERGCSMVLPRSLVTAHLMECAYRPVHICKILGLSSCNFDSCNPHDVIDHLTSVHNISRETEDFFSFDFIYASNSVGTKGLEKIKILGCRSRYTIAASTTSSTQHHRHSFSFLFILKEDEKSGGMLALCLFMGSSLTESKKFRTAYYFTSKNAPKCVASWPVVWYKDPIVTRDDGPGSVWDCAYHISAHTLKVIQGQDESINLLIRIRDAEHESAESSAPTQQ